MTELLKKLKSSIMDTRVILDKMEDGVFYLEESKHVMNSENQFIIEHTIELLDQIDWVFTQELINTGEECFGKMIKDKIKKKKKNDRDALRERDRKEQEEGRITSPEIIDINPLFEDIKTFDDVKNNLEILQNINPDFIADKKNRMIFEDDYGCKWLVNSFDQVYVMPDDIVVANTVPEFLSSIYEDNLKKE
jgi:hypothetical protein